MVMVSMPPKQANSLSDLLYLAANPPQYPEKPHEERREPLVLYIARIPGSQDIILSPSKPADKHIRLQDVIGSLYYVHLNLKTDQVPLPATPQPFDVTGSPRDPGSPPMAIPRKPLPDNARPITPESASSPNLNLAPALQTNRRRGTSLNSHDGRTPDLLPIVSTDPIPSPERSGQPPQYDSHRLQAPPIRKPVGGQRAVVPSVEVSHALPIPTTAGRSRSHSAAGPAPTKGMRSSYASFPSSPRNSTSAREPYSLTLIRQDPSAGTQQIVATITSQQPESHARQGLQSLAGLLKTFPCSESASVSCPPINIYVQNLGYSKFRRMPQRHSLTAAGLSALAANAALDDSLLAPPDSSVFSRQLQMSYSKSLVTNLKDKLHRLEEQMSKKGHKRESSDSSRESDKETSPGQPGPGMKPRGYTFMSPWNARCDFRTSLCDRSVRCYQVPARDATTSFNPISAEQGCHRRNLSSSSPSEPLSELRFNLPYTELFINTDPEGARDESMRARRHIGKPLSHDGNDDDDGDFGGGVFPFNLDAGEDLAGGGIHGDRAKLGKLIIHHDGLKMLDLLVAANIGVWWGAWERSSS